jgi:uncharacterized membrane protein YtjA (UPF0391 family)
MRLTKILPQLEYNQGSDQHSIGGTVMLRYAIIFLVIAIIAAIFGFGGIAGTASTIAVWLFWIAVIIFVVTLIMGLVSGRRP